MGKDCIHICTIHADLHYGFQEYENCHLCKDNHIGLQLINPIYGAKHASNFLRFGDPVLLDRIMLKNAICKIKMVWFTEDGSTEALFQILYG